MMNEERKRIVREVQSAARLRIRRLLRALRLVPQVDQDLLDELADDITTDWLAANLKRRLGGDES